MIEPQDELRKKLFATMTEVGGRLRVSGALNPILWLCGVIAVPCLVCLAWSAHPPVVITVVLLAVVGTALLSFMWLFIFDRDRLQSEDYLIRSRTLDLIEEKGSDHAIDATTVNSISQKEFLTLTDADEGELK